MIKIFPNFTVIETKNMINEVFYDNDDYHYVIY